MIFIVQYATSLGHMSLQKIVKNIVSIRVFRYQCMQQYQFSGIVHCPRMFSYRTILFTYNFIILYK